MSGREWAPGDVAHRLDVHHDAAIHFRTARGWIDAEGYERTITDAVMSDVHVARPLAVIDYKDDAAVDRFADLYTSEGAGRQCGTRAAIAWALREFTNPTPLIEEPTGLGAVVIGRDGRRWVRIDSGGPLPWRTDDGKGDFEYWADIDAVKVLSEGVTS